MGTIEARIQLSDGRELAIDTETGDSPDFEEISRNVYLNRVPVGDDPAPASYTDGRTLSRLSMVWVWMGVPVAEEDIPALMELAL